MLSSVHKAMVGFCIYSGDPGCLGWPDWHFEDCAYEERECLFCDCGGNDVYGEMWHEEGCALVATCRQEIPPQIVGIESGKVYKVTGYSRRRAFPLPRC